MFVRIEELCINIDRIDTLGLWENNPLEEQHYSVGLMINGERYTVFSTSEPGPVSLEVKEEFRRCVRDVQSEILSYTKQQVITLTPEVPFKNSQPVEEIQ